jgi:hypothetical protein
MPRGPRGEKRPADVIGAAVMVGRIATALPRTANAATARPNASAPGRPGLSASPTRSPAFARFKLRHYLPVKNR